MELGGSITGRSNAIFSTPIVHSGSTAHPTSYSKGNGGKAAEA